MRATIVRTFIVMSSAFLIASCGGSSSGGAAGGNGNGKCGKGVSGNIILTGCTVAGTFSFYRSDDTTPLGFPVHLAFPVDLNGDGVEEIIFAGFETQPNTGANYSNTSVHIFGWVDNSLTEITDTWLPGGINEVEAVGDIAFGDFDNNSHIDVYLSANADMDPDASYTTNAYALMNNGTSFIRVTLGENAWEHGVAAGDINGDNYDDVIVGGYQQPSVFLLGGPGGLTKYEIQAQDAIDYSFNNFETHASAVAIGDFLANGSKTVVVVDSAANSGGSAITTVVENMASEVVGFRHSSDLPAPLLGADSHDVRVHGFNFDSDSDTDIIVFSRENWNGTEWPVNSRLQFLRNDGGGSFTDVTSTILVGYDTNSNVTYTPVFKDFNGDGRIDIFVSDAEFSDTHNSTSILLKQIDGTFVDTGRSELSSMIENGGKATIARGPGGTYYLVTNKTIVGGSSVNTTVYVAEISWP